ncbi:hypothetical protein EAM_2139 [Erwinia amylovora ATCC 49946]|nr:hypothetical protein EAM_2139 [Erwinia amylovora ATCC 49946]
MPPAICPSYFRWCVGCTQLLLPTTRMIQGINKPDRRRSPERRRLFLRLQAVLTSSFKRPVQNRIDKRF